MKMIFDPSPPFLSFSNKKNKSYKTIIRRKGKNEKRIRT